MGSLPASLEGLPFALKYPAARCDDSVDDDYRSVPVPDPYRWLLEDPEDEEESETMAMEEQSEFIQKGLQVLKNILEGTQVSLEDNFILYTNICAMCTGDPQLYHEYRKFFEEYITSTGVDHSEVIKKLVISLMLLFIIDCDKGKAGMVAIGLSSMDHKPLIALLKTEWKNGGRIMFLQVLGEFPLANGDGHLVHVMIQAWKDIYTKLQKRRDEIRKRIDKLTSIKRALGFVLTAIPIALCVVAIPFNLFPEAIAMANTVSGLIKFGVDWCFEKKNDAIQEEMQEVDKLLDALSTKFQDYFGAIIKTASVDLAVKDAKEDATEEVEVPKQDKEYNPLINKGNQSIAVGVKMKTNKKMRHWTRLFACFGFAPEVN